MLLTVCLGQFSSENPALRQSGGDSGRLILPNGPAGPACNTLSLAFSEYEPCLIFQDLGHSVGSQFSSSSPMTIDVPLSDMGHGLLGHNQLTTIDQSELSAQLGLSLGGGAILACSQSPDQPLSAAASPVGSLQDDDMDDFRRVSPIGPSFCHVCLLVD